MTSCLVHINNHCSLPVIVTIAAPPIARNNAMFSVFSSTESSFGPIVASFMVVKIFPGLDRILGLVVGDLCVGGSSELIGISQLSPRKPRQMQKYSAPWLSQAPPFWQGNESHGSNSRKIHFWNLIRLVCIVFANGLHVSCLHSNTLNLIKTQEEIQREFHRHFFTGNKWDNNPWNLGLSSPAMRINHKLWVIIYLVDSEIRKSRASSRNQNHLIDQHKFRHFDKDLFDNCLHLKYAFIHCKVHPYDMSHTIWLIWYDSYDMILCAIMSWNHEIHDNVLYVIHNSNPLIQLGLTLALFRIWWIHIAG